jgi:hypothetical protein
LAAQNVFSAAAYDGDTKHEDVRLQPMRRHPKNRETPMLRKTTFALAAATLVATAAIPTAASAHWRDGWRHHHRPHYGVSVRYAAPYYAYSRYCFTKKRWVRTYWGWRVQRVRVCR